MWLFGTVSLLIAIIRWLGSLDAYLYFSKQIHFQHTHKASFVSQEMRLAFFITMSFLSFLAVFFGGGLGSVCRFAISSFLPVPACHCAAFPFRTFWANLAGCFLIGLLSALFLNTSVRPELKNFLVAGFCGGFTTFSTFSRESFDLLASGQYAVAAAYVAFSLVLGLACVALGFWIMSRIVA